MLAHLIVLVCVCMHGQTAWPCRVFGYEAVHDRGAIVITVSGMCIFSCVQNILVQTELSILLENFTIHLSLLPIDLNSN